MIKRFSRYFFDSTVYKAVTIGVFMLIPSFVFCFFPGIVSAGMLLWGAAILVHDLLKKRDFAKQTGSMLLVLFCIGYAVTLLIYAKNDLISTIHIFCWVIVEFFLLFSINSKKDTANGTLLDQVYFINIVVSAVALLSGLASLYCFFTKLCVVMPDPEGLNAFWSLGIVNGRNAGIFNNAIPCANAMFLGVVAALFNLVYPHKKSKVAIGYYFVTVVVCFLCVLTTLTRTYIYGVYIFAFVAAFAAFYQNALKNGKGGIKRFLVSLCVAGVICGVTIGTAEVCKDLMVNAIKNVEMSYILIGMGENNQNDGPTDGTTPTVPPTDGTTPTVPPTDVTDPTVPPTGVTDPSVPSTEATDPSVPPTDAPEPTAPEGEKDTVEDIFANLGLWTDVDLEREELDRLPNFLYPRDELWKIALDVIPHSPVFGFSSGNRNSSSVEYSFTDYRVNRHPNGVTTYHNSYFDIAVSSGLLGLGLILVFLGIQIYRALRVLFTKRILVPHARMRIGYGILLGYLAVHVVVTCMFFNALIFNNMSVCLYFWAVLGYVSKISDNELGGTSASSAEGFAKRLLKWK